VDLVYSHFVSAMTRHTVRQPFLPIVGPEPPAGAPGAPGAPARPAPARDYIFEPDAAHLVGRLLPRYVTTRMLQAFAASHYLPVAQIGDPTARRALDRLQMELVATRVSALNQCLY